LVGLAHVHSQLAKLTMQLQDMVKTIVVLEHIWCSTCRSEGHRKDHFPTLGNYLVMREMNPFLNGTQTKWCKICKQWGHISPCFPTLQKYQKTMHTLFCELCKSMGHDVNNFQSLQLMHDHTHNAF
jgi:hypothetical protein